jgi:phage I-like protein
MTKDTDRLSFTLESGIPDTGDGPPEMVQFLPSGEVSPKGKPSFVVDEQARKEILQAFGEGETDMVVDYEHQSLSGSEAPAAGWVRGLQDRGEDGIWASVEWTARAVEYLKNREYRYISPVILIRKSDGRAVELLGAALTNLPAIDGMEPVVNKGACAACGLSPELSDGYAFMYKRVMAMLELPEDAAPEAASEAIASLKSVEGFVPVSDYDALKMALAENEAETLIREALADGRLTPALKGWAHSYAATDMDGFREFLGRACPVVPLGNVSAGERVDAGQAKVNALLGITKKTFSRYGAAEC